MPERITSRPIPLDACPRCPAGAAMGVPVALAGEWPDVTIRQVCLACRLVWDCSWQVDVFSRLGAFEDRRILARENLEAPPTDGVPFPAGPNPLFRSTEIVAA